VSESVRHNLDLLAARYAVPMARADEITAGLWGNPSLQGDTQFEPFGANWNQTSSGGPKEFDLGLSLPLDLSGKRSAAVDSAKAATRIAELGLLDALRQKVLQVRQGYIDVVDRQSQAALAQEKVGDYEKLVHILENRIGRRPVRPLLLNRAHLARDQARMDLRQRRSDLVNAKTALAVLLGRRPTENAFEASSTLRDFQLQNAPDKARVVAEALANRPDLLALRESVAKADLDLRLARRQIWDDFSVTFTLSSQGPESSNPSDPDAGTVPQAYSWDSALSIPLPVFDHNQGNIKKAGLTRQQSEAQERSLELSIEEELGEDLEQLKVGRSLIMEYESTQIKEARQVRDAEQTQFGTGNIELLDYFDAMEAYNSVLSSYYDAVAGYRKALAQLSASIGEESFR
jgi:cobalt-zinc-cadmium efflux system outer membrane protein